MKLLSFLIAFCFLISFCSQEPSCKNLPNQFNSYEQAIHTIKNVKFISTDHLPPGKSSWIKQANYYSCDGKIGYLIYRTDSGKEYVHEKIPISIWAEFKTATSSGSYYNYNIKGKFRLVPE